MTWREYHEATKHTMRSLSGVPHTLDWANMPDPFRHYEGVPLLDLPADPRPPGIPAIQVLRGARGSTAAQDGAAFLSQLLYYSAAISAAKRVPSTGYKYALRVNPSSGNLHPTEFHFIARGIREWPDGLYHYRPSSHMAEQRARGHFMAKPDGISSPLVFLLTSIVWREAWKYGERAYRYCLHDMGHAWQAVTLAARAMGCEAFAHGNFPEDKLAQICRLSQDEWPMLLVELRGAAIPTHGPDASATVWFDGAPNPLSDAEVAYPLTDCMHEAAKIGPAKLGPGCEMLDIPARPQLPRHGSAIIDLPPAAQSLRGFGEVARGRRSALDFKDAAPLTLPQLAAILDAAAQPFCTDFAVAPPAESSIQLYIYAHAVDGLEAGVYRHWPLRRELELIKTGDQRVPAAALSLRQQLAGNACVAFSMIADLERITATHGARGYRYAHFEAGAVGQRMYLAAEALGLQATGIGAFFDDEVHRYLSIRPSRGQVVYHFAIGHAVPDARLEASAMR